jgi:hypothetical protein
MLLVGCGSSSPFGNSVLLVYADDVSSFSPGRNYPVTFKLLDAGDGHCPISEVATLTVNDQSFGFVNCSAQPINLTQNVPLSIEIQDGSESAQAVIAQMAPGLDATVVDPASGTATPAGPISVAIPPELAGLTPGAVGFYYAGLDDSSYAGEFTYNGTATLDVATVQAPQHPGPFQFWIPMSSPDVLHPVQVSATVISCSGFSMCDASPVKTLGPLSIAVGS